MVPPFDRMYELWYKRASEQYFSKAHSISVYQGTLTRWLYQTYKLNS